MTSEMVWRPTRWEGSFQKGGEHFAFCTSARSDPEGKFRLLFTLPGHKSGPTEHAHPGESEVVEVVSGSVQIWQNGAMEEYGPGEVVEIRAGVPHRMHNAHAEPCVMRVAYAGATMEDVFVPTAIAMASGKSTFAAFAGMLIFVAEQRPTRPSSPFEVLAIRAIARLFKLFGYRAHQPVLGWDAQRA